MKTEQIQEMLQKFEGARHDYEGIECWSARELQFVFGYSEWRNFVKAIEKAQETCERSGNAGFDHFVELNKMVELQVPDSKPLADFLPTLTIKAKDFATELTSHNVVEKDLHGEPIFKRAE
jgi:DNA-damage-inducible protein D